MPCPSLNPDFTCSIHKNKGRSNTCHKFPIFIEGNKVKISPRCLAYREGLLYPYIAKLLSMGLVLVKSAQYSDQECFNNQFKRIDDIEKNKPEEEKTAA